MKEQKFSETGRSLVEMLGTLAVMGVLSVIGMAGFKIAMIKHSANDLLNELNVRASSIATQIATHSNPGFQPGMVGFNQGFSGCTECQFYVQRIAGQNRFSILVSNLPENICEQALKIIGPTSMIRSVTPCTDGEPVGFVFNNDLSTKEKDPCNDHGIILNGACSCYKGFSGTDCSQGAGEST